MAGGSNYSLIDGEEGPLREVAWKLLGWNETAGEGEACTPRACVCLIFIPTTGSQDSFPLPTGSAWECVSGDLMLP